MFRRHRRRSIERLEPRCMLSAAGVLNDVAVDIPDVSGSPGGHVIAPVNIDNAEGVRAAEIHIQYDTALLDTDNSGVSPGSVWPDTNIFINPNVDDAAGTIVVWIYGIEDLGPGGGSLVEIDFTIPDDAPVGEQVYLDLQSVLLNEGEIPCAPEPVEGNDATDGEITVVAVNHTPELAPIGDKGVDEQATLTFTASATDQDIPPQTLTYSLDATSLALGMTINATTGEFSWTPSESQGGQSYPATVTVTDNGTNPDNLSDSEPITITVNEVSDTTGRVNGFVYADTNRNYQPGEHEGVPGVLITLTGEGVSRETWTDDHGWFEFRGLNGGTYTIVERQPYCMIDGGGNTLTGVVVSAAQNTVGQNFRELGLKPQYVYNRLYSTSVMPVGSETWVDLIKRIVKDGEEDAGHVPSAPPAAIQQISPQGSQVVVRGTNGNDAFEFVAADTGGGQHEVTLNGETHRFDASVVNSILFDGGLGIDTATLTGSPAADQFDVSAKSASLRGTGYVVEVVRTEKTTTSAGNGAVIDKAVFADSTADDTLRAEIDFASLAAFYYEHVLHEFDEITALSSHGGRDEKFVNGAIDYVLLAEGNWIAP